jgi:hypothetical protein
MSVGVRLFQDSHGGAPEYAAGRHDVGSAAAFAASARAASITGAELNITCGAIVD